MQSTAEPDGYDEDVAARRAFSRRVMQIALRHEVGAGIDAIAGSRFQNLGFFKDAAPPEPPSAIIDILRSPDHPQRAPIPNGPLIFVRESESVAVFEVADLLLQSKHETRIAAFDYLQRSATGPGAWLTEFTAQALQSRAGQVRSDDAQTWRTAGIEIAVAVRSDLFAHFSGLRQSLVARFEEGIDQYADKVIRPSFESLAHFRPPLWNPIEQIEEIRKWMNELVEAPTIEMALSGYLSKFGSIPLRGEFAATHLVGLWNQRHPDAYAQWDNIWSWALMQENPAAKYHAISIGLQIPNLFPNTPDKTLWLEIAAIFDIRDLAELPESYDPKWVLFCETLSHYARHVCAIYPGQEGNRIACYAAWLSERFVEIFADNPQAARAALQRIVEPESEISFRRWMIAKSPWLPSPLMYAAVQVRSLWAYSLLGDIRRVATSVSIDAFPADTRAAIGTVLRACLIATPLADRADPSVSIFAFQDDWQPSDLGVWTQFLSANEQSAYLGVVSYRNQLLQKDELRKVLEKLGDESPQELSLTIYFLETCFFATSVYDDVLAEWLDDVDRFRKVLGRLFNDDLERFMHVLCEFQRRQTTDRVVRLPHLLVTVLDDLGSQEQISVIIRNIWMMSVGSDLVSPVRRIAASKYRASLFELMSSWRSNIVAIGKCSEPWVASRVRAIGATVSRLIGPRSYKVNDEVMS